MSNDEAARWGRPSRTERSAASEVERHHRSNYSASRQVKARLKPGPRKNTPMMTRTAQNIRNNVINEMANLRSSGLLLGFRSVYGARISPKSPTPGMVTPATIGWNMVSSSCRPRKYHGAFDGFGVA